MAKLSEIEGIGEAYSGKLEKAGIVSLADLLECAGIDTVPELAQRNPENLLSKMSDINGEKSCTKIANSIASSGLGGTGQKITPCCDSLAEQSHNRRSNKVCQACRPRRAL